MLNNDVKVNLAFFDIDGTFFRWSLFISITEKFIQEGVFSEDAKNEYQKYINLWKQREIEFNEFVQKTIKIYNKDIKGIDEDLFINISKDVVKAQAKHIYVFTRDLINYLKTKGYILIAVSHSPKYAVDEFANRWGFDMQFGVLFEKDKHGKLTGNILNNNIFDKGSYIKDLIIRHGFNPKNIVCVGDTESDISMLSVADVPIAFNPNAELFKEAKKRKWNIIVERKNVIYKIGNNCDMIKSVSSLFGD